MRHLSWMLVFGIIVTTVGGAFSLIDLAPLAANKVPLVVHIGVI